MLIPRLAQTINLTALGTMLGAAMFLLLICQPLSSDGGTAAFAARRCAEQLARLWVQAYIASLAAVVLWFCAECVMMSGRPIREAVAPPEMWMVLRQTQFGRQFTIHLGLMAVPGAYLLVRRRGKRAMSRPELLAAAVVSAGLLSHMACFSHAAAMSGVWRGPLLMSYAVHLAAAGIWLGGLPPLLMMLMHAHRHRNASWNALTRESARCFSSIGLVSVGALLATGAFNALLLVGTWALLTGSDYGRLLIAKVLLFAVMIGVAAVNKLWLTPELATMSTATERGTASPALRLLRNVAIEAGVGVAVLAIAATLGTTPMAIR